MNLRSFSALALAGALLFGLPAKPASAGTLFDDLGGAPGATKVIDDFLGFVVADGRINHYFAHADVPRLRANLIGLVCQATGGPCKYEGRSMPDAHKGMHITEADFNALVEDLEKSLDKNAVPFTTQNRLLAILAPLESQVDYK